MENRKKLLAEIIDIAAPENLDMLKSQLMSDYEWDVDAPVINLTAAHVVSILKRYINGQLTDDNVVAWADALEMREDISLGDDGNDAVADVLYTLASPALEGKLTPERAQTLIGHLQNKDENL